MSKSILVVEDDDDIRMACNEILTSMGHDVHLAEHGGKALQKLSERSGQFDLILLDSMMPKVSGEEFLMIQQAHPKWKDIPVVVMSALQELPSALKNKRVLKKPMGLTDLLRVVQ